MLSGFPALDVAIGLAFVYMILSLAASALQESFASIVGLRATMLEQGIRSMLEDPEKEASADKLLDKLASHRRIRGSVKSSAPTRTKDKWPSYLPARAFSLALVDTLCPRPGTGAADHDVLAKLQAALTGSLAGTKAPDGDDVRGMVDLLPHDLKQALLSEVSGEMKSIASLRQHIESWFDDTMDRVSGWYKRRVQIILFAIGLTLVLIFNVDTVQIANSLWNDQTLRTAVVAQAQKQDAQAGIDKVSTDVGGLSALKLPLGWAGRPAAGKTDPRAVPEAKPLPWLGKLFGLLVTAIALSFGAPFWFDLLSRFVRVRNTGPPEGGPKTRRPRADHDATPV
jgi:hypothetical protein